MTNIVTRKGLAFGALVALASTAIAGAPAHAAGEVVFVPNTGTSYNAFVTDSFTLNASLAAGQVASNIAQLKYSIALPAALAASNTIAYKVNGASTWTNSSASATTPEVISGSGSAVAANTLEIAIDTAATASLQAPAATADTKSVTVTAFIDSNNNSVADAGEFAQARTVTFKKYSEVTPTVTLTQPTVGASSASATVVVADMNYTSSLLKATFTGVTGATAAPGVAVNATTGVATDGSAVTSTAVTAQAYYNGVALGTAVSATPTARTISAVTASIAASDNSKASSAGAADVRIDGAWAAKVYAADLATPAAAAPAVAVKATVAVTGAVLAAATSSTSEVSITVAGVKYTSATDLAASFPVTTGTDGYASLAISTSGFANGNTVAVTFAAQNFTSTVTATAKTLAYTVTEANAATTRATLKNTAVAVAYTVKDQFGVKSAATNQRLQISASNSTTTSSAAQYVAVAAGVAGATITPVTDSTTAMVVHAVLQDSTYSTTTGATTWAGATAAVDAADITVNISSVAYGFTTAPALVGVASAAYNTPAGTNMKQVVTQAAVADLAASSGANGNGTWAAITLQGNVAGGVVAISAPGAFISTAAGVAGVADSATLYATGASQTVYVASNTVGTKTVTFTTGSVVKTVDVVFTSGATSTGATISVAVTTSAQSGRSIDATATVTDKFGNPVAGFALTATVSGVALVNGAATVTAPVTDANGKTTVKLSAGVNDLGDAVVTFADATTNSVPASAAVAAVAKTVTFGSTDGYIDVLNGKRASVTWSFAKGKRVAVYLDGVRRYNIVQPGDSELNLQFNMKAGSHSVKLVIGGVIVDTVSVKVAK